MTATTTTTTTTATTIGDREPAGKAFQRLTAELAEARKPQGWTGILRRFWGQSERQQLELLELKPRLRYDFDLPQDASLAIMGQLGKARCRTAMACRGFRAAVGDAELVGAFNKPDILAVAAGLTHTIVCTKDAVFSFGNQDGINYGVLGYATDQHLSQQAWLEGQAKPCVVEELLTEDVATAAACNGTTLFCTTRGEAFLCGTMVLRDAATMMPIPVWSSAVPKLVGGLQQVVGVGNGEAHLLAWTRSGQLYAWGSGIRGQLGHGSRADEAEPRLVEGLVGQQVVEADGGLSYSVARTTRGQVFTFGEAEWRLGLGSAAAAQQHTPKLVDGLTGSTVTAVQASHYATIAITEKGEVYTWGISPHCLGHGEKAESYPNPNPVCYPRLVAGLAGKRVAGVAAGSDHMLAWTDLGELYSWGCSDDGQLGHNSTQGEYSPRQVEALAGEVVVNAAAGWFHSVVVTWEDDVFTFGGGALTPGSSIYALKHGPLREQPTPRLLEGLEWDTKPLK